MIHRRLLSTNYLIGRSFLRSSEHQLRRQRFQYLHTSSSVVNQIPSPSEKEKTFNSSSSFAPRNTQDHKFLEHQHHHPHEAVIYSTVDQVLESKDPEKVNLSDACQIIYNLAQMKKSNPTVEISLSKLQEDVRFIRLHNLVQKGNHLLNPYALFKAMLALESIGFSKESYFVKELESELKWTMRRCHIRFLPKLIYAYVYGHKEEDLLVGVEPPNSQAKLVNEKTVTDHFPSDHPIHVALNILQRRWVEVTSGSDFMSVFRISNILAAETRDKLEDRAVEVVQDFKPMEMLKIFIALAEQKRRPTPLLRSLAFHLSKSTEKILAKDLIDLLYALNELTFGDPVLMERICNDLQPEIAALDNPAAVSSIVTCIGQMRYNHPALIQSLGEWLSKNLDSLRPFDCAAWILATAVIGISSNQFPELSAKVSSEFTKKTTETQVEWINIVHGLSILNLVTSDLVSSVLEGPFVKSIDALERNMATKVKLLNLNFMAKSGSSFGISNYKGSFLDKSLVLKWTSSYLSPNDPNMTKSVIDSLSNFLPPPKYLKTNVKLDCGVFVDGLCCVSEKLDLLPVTTEHSKAKKLAILVQGYPVFTLGHKVPTGGNTLNIRILENQGYSVITVPYTEYSPKDKLVRRVQFLEKRIRNLEDIKIDYKEEPSIENRESKQTSARRRDPDRNRNSSRTPSWQWD